MSKTKEQKAPHERIHALDLIRGVLIIGMIIDHTIYDTVMIFDLPWVVFDNPLRYVYSSIGSTLFVLLSGISAPISRNIIKRGLILALFAAGMSFFSWLGDRDFYIKFGILHLLSFCMLFYGIFGRYLRRIPQKAYFFVLCLLYVGTKIFTRYCTWYGGVSWIIGLKSPAFASLDYYPILPWIFIYLIGAWFSPYIFEKKLPRKFYEVRCIPIEMVGRYSIWVYLAHQPIIYGALMILHDLTVK